MSATLSVRALSWLDPCPHPALSVSASGELLYANSALLDRLHWSLEELQGDPARLCPPGQWEEFCRLTHADSAWHPAQKLTVLDSYGQPYLGELVRLGERDGEAPALVLRALEPAPEPSLLPTLAGDAASNTGNRHVQGPYLRLDVEFDEEFQTGRILATDGLVPGLQGLSEEDWPKLEEMLEPGKWLHLRTELAHQSPTHLSSPVLMDLSLKSRDAEVHWYNVALVARPELGSGVWTIEGWDITRRHLQESCRRLSSQLMSILNVDADFEDLARDVLEYLELQLELDFVAVQYQRAGGDTIRVTCCDEPGAETRLGDLRVVQALLQQSDDPARAPQEILRAEGLDDGYRFTQLGSYWLQDARSRAGDDPAMQRLTEKGVASLALVPIRSGGSTIGLLAFGSRAPGRFDDAFVQLLEELAFAVGNAIQRENSLRVVRRSEERYRGLFESSRDGIAIRNLDGRLVAANHAYLSLIHQSLDSLRDLPRSGYLSLLTPADSATCYPGALLRDGYTEDHEMVLMTPGHDPLPVLGREWVIADETGTPTRAMEILRDISETKRAESERQRLVAAIEQADEVVMITDRDGAIQYANPAFERVTGYTRQECMGENPRVLSSGKQDAAFYADLWKTITSGETWKGRLINMKKNGDLFQEDATISPILDDSGRIVSYVAVKRDVTEFVELEAQLLQAQKLESIGRLAAGIAHEINTPSQYVGDNLQFLGESLGDLLELFDRSLAWIGGHEAEDSAAELLRQAEDLDLEFLQEEIASAVSQSQEGMSRIKEIVSAMKSFSHPGSDSLKPVDIHEAIRGTVTVARNEWKYVSDLEFVFDDDLGMVPCLVNEFNQVVLNMIINAKHAIEEKGLGQDEKGLIRISTRRRGDYAEIRISDTGAGIEPQNLAKIFDQFFTTKTVGKGTGQGLALSRDIIVNKHGGRIDVESELGEGTTFIILLPRESETNPIEDIS